MVEFEWASERWGLSAERALWWERRRTLCIADVHLGKGAAFRRAGVPVPEGATDADLSRLSRLVSELGAKRLVILGDLLHARAGRGAETMESFARWRSAHRELDILLIRGNHDVSAGDPPREWGMRVEDELHADIGDGKVRFAHVPGASERAAGTAGAHVLCGHVHPAVAMMGATIGARASCFWFAEQECVLPAFGSFTGTKVVRPAGGDRVFALGEGEVVEVRGVAATSAHPVSLRGRGRMRRRRAAGNGLGEARGG